MRLKNVIRAEKGIESWGEWQTGPVARKHFPLSKAKAKALKLGRSACWRLVKFSCLGADFRVLVVIDEAKEEFRAWLGLIEGNDTTLLLRHEFHGSHPGWHVHSHCEDIAEAKKGVVQMPSSRRIPTGSGNHRRVQFDTSKEAAMEQVARYFGLTSKVFRLQ